MNKVKFLCSVYSMLGASLYAAENSESARNVLRIVAPGMATHPWHKLKPHLSLFYNSKGEQITLVDGTKIPKNDFIKTCNALGMLSIDNQHGNHLTILAHRYQSTCFKNNPSTIQELGTALIEQFVIERDPTLKNWDSDFKEPRDTVKKIIKASMSISKDGSLEFVDPTGKW